MAIAAEVLSELGCRFGVLLPHLNERQRRFGGGGARGRGGGRGGAEDSYPAVLQALLAMVEPDERGDPQSPLRWTTKSLRHLAEELTRRGDPGSAPTGGGALKAGRVLL